jgi:hypothetical protein
MIDSATQALPSHRVAYVTGADERFSLLAQALHASFGEHCPGHTLWVCDFGLGDSRRREFRARGVLLERPRTLPETAHPWVYKAHLRTYMESLSAEWLVWLDSDCLITGPLSEAVAAVIATAPPEPDVIAICQGRLGSTFEIVQRLSGTSELMDRCGIPGETPYYNSGVYVVRSPALLTAWSREIDGVAQESMFEQNLFNVLLQRGRLAVIALDHDVWNVTHDALNECTVVDERVFCRGKEVLVLHATGSFREVTIDATGRRGYFRALTHAELWKLQQRALAQWP